MTPVSILDVSWIDITEVLQESCMWIFFFRAFSVTQWSNLSIIADIQFGSQI